MAVNFVSDFFFKRHSQARTTTRKLTYIKQKKKRSALVKCLTLNCNIIATHVSAGTPAPTEDQIATECSKKKKNPSHSQTCSRFIFLHWILAPSQTIDEAISNKVQRGSMAAAASSDLKRTTESGIHSVKRFISMCMPSASPSDTWPSQGDL